MIRYAQPGFLVVLIAAALPALPAACRAQALPGGADPSPARKGGPAPPPSLQQPEPEEITLPKASLSLQRLLALPPWVKLEVESIAQPFANPFGGRTRSGAWMQQTTLEASFGTGLDEGKDPDEAWEPDDAKDAGQPVKPLREIDHWSVDLLLSFLNGNPDYGAQIGATYSPQALYAPVGVWPTRLSLARRSEGGRWDIEAGILPFDSTFLTPPISGLYVSALVGAAPGLRDASFPISPASGPGGVLSLRPTPTSTLRIGSFDLSAVGAVSDFLGVRSGIPVGPGWLNVVQLELAPRWLDPNREDTTIRTCRRNGRLSLRCSEGDRPVVLEGQLPPGRIQLAGYAGVGSIQGIYGHASVPLVLPWGLDHRVWLAATYGGSSDQNPNPPYIGGGLVSQGLLPGRPFDRTLLGIARAGYSPTLTPALSWEGALEVGHRFQINDALSLQPTGVWILRPGGSGKVAGIGSFGLQISWTF